MSFFMQLFVTLDTIKQEQGVIPVGWASTRASLGCSTVTHVLWVRPHEGPLLQLHLSATVSIKSLYQKSYFIS